jgi:GNAT superfamily N-acetyltransferase
MNLREEAGGWQISFKHEHLPRTMTVKYPADERRLRLYLPDPACFLVAAARDTGEVIGYLTLRQDVTYRIARLDDVVVSLPFRRNRIGSRLLKVARKWAAEHDLVRMTAATQTKNFPAIQFCQAMGFAFCGFDDHYFENQDIAVFFSQTLR